MHLTPVHVFVNCERCGCQFSVPIQHNFRVVVCQDCRNREITERKRLRSCWSPGDYHMIHDPTDSWSPTPGGTWLDRAEVIWEMGHGNLEPGTRFECRGQIYEVSLEYRLIKIQGNNENANTEATWNTGTNARPAGQSTD